MSIEVEEFHAIRLEASEGSLRSRWSRIGVAILGVIGGSGIDIVAIVVGQSILEIQTLSPNVDNVKTELRRVRR